jgi:hypothetical protein
MRIIKDLLNLNNVAKYMIDEKDIVKDELEYFNLLHSYNFKILFKDVSTFSLINSKFIYSNDNTIIYITMLDKNKYCINLIFLTDIEENVVIVETDVKKIQTILNKYLPIESRKIKLKNILLNE